jgi:hypothetical protein
MAARFNVYGPFEIPIVKYDSGARWIYKDGLSEFWDETGCASDSGCYVFAMRSGGGIMPWYAGRSTGPFKNECFTNDKILKYQLALAKVAKGKPVMFLVSLEPQKGPKNIRAIEALEKTLIVLGFDRNVEFINKIGKEKSDFIIGGIVGPGSGKPSSAAATFKSTMGFRN